jgi:hypothetical protein
MVIAWIRRAWSRQDGNLYSRKREKALIAASRTLRVRAELARVRSICARNAKARAAHQAARLHGVLALGEAEDVH